MEDLFVRAGEITMHALKHGKKNGRPLVFIHGYVASSWWWRGQMEALENDFTCWAIDMRGCGESDKMRNGYSVEQMADDVASFMESQNIKTATVVGHSMGGFIAQALALNHADRVRKLVLVCTAPTGENHPGLAFGAIDSVLHPDITFEWTRSLVDMLYGQPAAEHLRDMIAGEMLKACRDAYLQQMSNLTRTNMTTQLRNITAPTLVIVGKNDAFFPDATYFKEIQNLTVEVFEKSAHMPMFQESEKFSRVLVTFAK